MRIDSLDKFASLFVNQLIGEGMKPVTLYIASKKFRTVDPITFTSMPIIGYGGVHSVLDRNIKTSEPTFIHWVDEDGHQQVRSLLDINIIPNRYNDWHVFDNKDEAELHAGLKNPGKALDNHQRE